jgi:flagella basal body P-ring formation protein FlgA
MAMRLLLAGCCLLLAGGPIAAADSGTSLAAALVAAVQARMGEHVDVTVDQVRVVTAVPVQGGRLVADPQPGSQVGGKVRFALRFIGDDGRLRVGAVECVVRVTGPTSRLVHDVERGHVLREEDIEVVHADVGRIPLQPLEATVVGHRTRRALRMGEHLRAAFVEPVSLVRSGDRLTVRVRVGEVEVTTAAIASQHGQVGEIIRAVNADTGRRLRVRITGPAEGEVIHAS